MNFKSGINFTIAAILIITAVLFYNVYEEVEEETKQQLGEQLKVHAQLASKGIEQFFKDYQDDLAFLTDLEFIVNVNTETDSILLDYYNRHSDYLSAVTRIDKFGKIVSTIPKVDSVIGKDVSMQAHNKKIMESHLPVISDVFTAVQGYKTVAVAYPVFKDSVYTGCVSLLIPFENVTSQFLKNIHIGNSGYAYMISRNGIELYCKYDEHNGQFINIEQHYSNSLTKLFNSLTGDEQRIIKDIKLHNDLKESDNLAYYHPIRLADNQWSLIVTVPTDEVFAITDGFRNKLMLIVLAFIVLTLLFTYIYYKRRINLAEKINEQKMLFSTIGKETGLLLYDYNIDTGKIDWSGAIDSVLGYSQNEMRKYNITEWGNLIHPDDLEEISVSLNNSITKRNNFSTEYRIKTRKGDYIFVEDNGIFLNRSDKESKRLVGIMRDITERNNTEKELRNSKNNLEQIVKERTEELNQKNIELQNDIKTRQKIEVELRTAKEQAEVSDKLKSEFLAQMSHEIRTPISTIMNFTALLKMEFENKTSEENSHSFEAIENAADRLLRTIDLVLNLSDVEAGTYKPHIIDIDLDKHILMPLVNEFRIKAKRKGIDLEYKYDPAIKPIKLDRYTITQIFANLIDNAIKYTRAGTVTINITQNETHYNCEIIDTGIGISEDYLPKLFEVFSQEEQGYTRKYDGSGLGLALVQNYCRINNAVIEVESKKGEGSKFTVKLSR